jgi:hypothetical protein
VRVAHRPRVTTRASAPIVAVSAALWLLALVAGPVAAAGPTLSDPVVDPRTGSPSTTFSLRVTYTDGSSGRHWAPDWVRVRIDGTTHWMSRNGDRDWSDGITYRWSGLLPIGSHAVAFEARSDRNVLVSLPAGTIVVAVPATPSPKPTPRPSPKPTPKPRPKPTSRPPTATHRPDPAPVVAPQLVKPSPTAAPVAGGVVVPTVVGGMADGGSTPDGTPPPWILVFPTATPVPSASPDAIALVPPGSGTDTPGDGTGGQPDPPSGPRPTGGHPADPTAWGPMAAVLTFIGLPPHLPILPLAPTLVTTTGIATASMALGLFGRRRRDEQQPGTDDELADLASQGIGIGADGAAGAADGEAEDLVGDDLTPEMESLLPRWRRPSLMQARKADPLREADDAPRLRFDDGLAIAGQERRFVRYTVVRLLDAPDELRANEIGVLGTGDEVVVMERQGVYCLVQAPNGGRGWIHKMTLGDVVGPAPAVVESPTASLPVSADTWTMGESDGDIDDDVLAAYLAARQRAV